MIKRSMATGGIGKLPRAGRDGQSLRLEARVLVNSEPNKPDEWAPFSVSHPIERKRLNGSLGRDEAEEIRRYKAARVWMRLFLSVNPGGKTAGLTDRVDSSGNSSSWLLRLIDATSMRTDILKHGRGITQRRFADLDAICGREESFRGWAKVSGRHWSTVTESVITGLDAVAEFDPWQDMLDREPVLKIEKGKRPPKKAA